MPHYMHADTHAHDESVWSLAVATCALVLQCSRGQAVPLPTFERVAEDVRVGDVVGVVGFPAKTKIGVLSIIPHAVPPLSAHASPMPGFSHTHGCCGLIAPASLADRGGGVAAILYSQSQYRQQL